MTATPDPSGPRGLTDDGQRLAWLREAYYGLDGRWYLKVRDRWGAEPAQDVDEEVCRSLGRLHVRRWLELTGRESIEDCTVLGRFVLDVFDALYGGADRAVRVVTSEPDVWVMQHLRCTIFEMGVAAGYQGATPIPGELPGCGGILALYQGWTDAAGPFVVEQSPASDGSDGGGVACRYSFRRTR